jgi:hypothetical protein
MKKKTQQCPHCGKMFRGVKTHLRFCPERFTNQVTTKQKREFTQYDLNLAERAGFARGKEETEKALNATTKFNEIQIKAITAAAQAVDAIAHMMAELRRM